MSNASCILVKRFVLLICTPCCTLYLGVWDRERSFKGRSILSEKRRVVVKVKRTGHVIIQLQKWLSIGPSEAWKQFDETPLTALELRIMSAHHSAVSGIQSVESLTDALVALIKLHPRYVERRRRRKGKCCCGKWRL